MRRLYVLLLVLFASLCVKAQISVKEGSFKEAGQFFTMKEDMTDDNYTPFAVIKVKTENMTAAQVEQLGFSGNALTYIDAEFHETEVWVYLTYLAPYLKITHPDLSSTEFTIPYDMKPLHGYELVLINGAVSRNAGGKGVLTVTTNPAGAIVFLNGVKVSETTPYTNEMIASGHYEIMVKHKNYQNAVRQVDIVNGKNVDINIDMDLSYSKININTNPSSATVYIDGVKKGKTPLVISDMKIGNHVLKLVKEEFETIEENIALEEDKELVIDRKLAVAKVVKTFKVKDVSFDMILVKGNATINDFYIGQFEVTQELWKAVMRDNPSKNGGSKGPVEWVTWDDCQAFIKKLNKITKANFRLPTKAEWQYAAQGGKWSKGYEYSGSNDIDAVAWYGENTGSYLVGNYSKERQQDYFNMTRCSRIVGRKQPNELGLYDMSGNVFEFCSDNGNCVAKGGSFKSSSKMCTIKAWVKLKPDEKYNDLGLRLVMQ